MRAIKKETYDSLRTENKRGIKARIATALTECWELTSLDLRKYLFKLCITQLKKGTQAIASCHGKIRVYDIVNAGPQSRFLVHGNHPAMAHNCDFGSQESWIAAVVSGDKELIHAYQSGDPYLAFAISAKAAPRDATKKSHGDVRNLFKSTVLGMSYGMGANKLAVKLNSDMGKPFSVNEAKELIRLHKEVYWRYYEWKDEVWHSYRNERTPISLPDGWYLDCHASSKMSVLNMPVQGAGSAMMRVAVDDIIGQGIKLLCPVHDSFVFMCAESEIEKQCALVTKAMIEASKLVLGVDGMRVGAPDILRHGEYWYTDKNRASLERYKTYFEEKHNSQNKLSFIDKLLDF